MSSDSDSSSSSGSSSVSSSGSSVSSGDESEKVNGGDIFASAGRKKKEENGGRVAGKKRPREGNDDEVDPDAKRVKKGAWKKREANTLYINQIPYKTSQEEIVEFVCSADGVTKDDIVQVRLVKDKKKVFKGIAFVELVSEEKKQLGLALDKTKLKTRKVNVMSTRSRQEVWEERKKKKEYIESIQMLGDSEIQNLFDSVNESSKSKRKVSVKPSDFDTGIQKYMRTLTEKELRKAIMEYCVKTTTGKLKNRNSFFLSIMRNIKTSSEDTGGIKSGGVAAAGEKKESNDSGLTSSEVVAIIKTSSKPRRSKKQKGEEKSNGKGRLPPTSKSPLWSDFDPQTLKMMEKMSAPELKRNLSHFYKSKNFEKIKDKSRHFRLMVEKKN